jgi:hypothetical protein
MSAGGYTHVSEYFSSRLGTQVHCTVDNSTGVIECMLHHPLPYAHLETKSRLEAVRLSKLSNALPLPPPNPVTAIGYPIQVISKVTQFHDQQ